MKSSILKDQTLTDILVSSTVTCLTDQLSQAEENNTVLQEPKIQSYWTELLQGLGSIYEIQDSF